MEWKIEDLGEKFKLIIWNKRKYKEISLNKILDPMPFEYKRLIEMAINKIITNPYKEKIDIDIDAIAKELEKF